MFSSSVGSQSANTLTRMVGRASGLYALVAATCLAQNAPAPGQGDWVYIAGNTYRGSQYYWAANYVPCCGWKYQRLQAVVQVPVVGRADFYEQALASLTKQQSETEQRQFLQQMFPTSSLQTAGYANGYTKTGVSVYQQGYGGLVTGGQTLYGTASYAASNVDVNGIIHEAQRLADRVLGASEAAVAGAQDIVATAVDGNSKAAQITASAQVAAAAIQAANPPVQRVEATRTEPAPPQQMQQAPPPPGPHTGDSGSVNQQLYGRIALNSCVKCHSGQAPRGNIDLSLASINAMGPAERADLAGKIANRIDPNAPDDKRMPKGQKPLPDKMRSGLLQLVSSN